VGRRNGGRRLAASRIGVAFRTTDTLLAQLP
jgi:hypothetical protein